MSINSTKVAAIKDMLATIAEQDVKLVIATNKAMERMATLGLHQNAVQAFLDAEPYSKEDDGLFHGFASRQQAQLAVWGATRKSDRPGALGDVHDRVNTLIKVQVPERAAQTIGIAVVSIPAQSPLPPAPESVKTFRRLADGRLRELKGVASHDDAIDAESEVVESTFTMKREAK